MFELALLLIMNIITVDGPNNEVLRESAVHIEELSEAQEIAGKLYAALQPHLPAAGLAAPQIGISKAMFIFSYDRDPKHLEIVINPSFFPVDDEKFTSWEGCFSTTLSPPNYTLAKVSRYETIKVNYTNLEGNSVEKTLSGFAAKVFQHECDHLRGVVNIDREEAEIKTFDSQEAMFTFMQKVKEEDSKRYQ